jgi:C4-dicarboxylate-specific signal transduction histidine kinase
MMEVSIKHVPNLIEMVQKIPTLVLTAHQSAADTNKKQEALTELPLLTQFKASSRTLYTIYAYIIDNIYLAGINFDVGTALNEDQNFHGTSKSLQEKLPKQTEILMSKLQIYTDLVREIGVSTQLDSFKLAQASEQALRSAEEFWQISYEELEKLLKIRIDDLSTSRSLCILWTLISIALAVLMDVIVIRKFKSIEDEKENQRQIIEQQRGNLESSARLSSLGEMAGGIAHEINNPLAVIAGTASQLQRLARKGNLPTEFIVTHSVTIMETADRIGKIVTGLRTFARDGKHDQLVPTSLQKVIDQTVGFSESRFRDRGIALRVEIPSDLPLVDCRGVQISQVVLNLLNNAFDAVVDAKDPFILLKIEERGSDIEISVTDNGSGVAPELRDKIMQPFFTTKEVGKGTGLGLSITSGIIKAHDGAFFLDPNSRLTRFVIRIPKTQKKDHLRVRDVA